MNARTELSYTEVQKYVAIARKLRAEVWASLMRGAVRGVGRLVRAAFNFVVKATRATAEHARRAQRRSATIEALSGLPDQILKDIGLHRSEIFAVANEVSKLPRPSRPVAIRPMAHVVTRRDAGTQAANEGESAAA